MDVGPFLALIAAVLLYWYAGGRVAAGKAVEERAAAAAAARHHARAVAAARQSRATAERRLGQLDLELDGIEPGDPRREALAAERLLVSLRQRAEPAEKVAGGAPAPPDRPAGTSPTAPDPDHSGPQPSTAGSRLTGRPGGGRPRM